MLKKVFLFIVFVAAVKILLSSFLELGNDEVYYITYVRHLQFNYFDHPPMVGAILKLFSLDLFLRNEIFLRLGFVVCGSISLWLVFKIGKHLYNETAGWFACLLFTASVYTCIISGFMIMPDAPMLVFWLWAFYLALKIINKEKNQYILLFGVAVGLAIMSKVSAVMLWVGFGSYILFFQQSLLKKWNLYISVLITVIISFPVSILSFLQKSEGAAYHANRITISSLQNFRFDFFLQQILGEIAYTNPVCYVLIIIGIVYVIKKNILSRKYTGLIFCFASPLILFVWFSSLYNQTLPHWTGPSFVLLLFFAAIMMAHKMEAGKKKFVSLYIANGLIVLLLATVIIGVKYLPVAFNKNEPKLLGKGDLLLDFSGWKEFQNEFNKIYDADIQSGHMKRGAFIVSDYWFPAAHLDWYVAEPLGINFKAIGDVNAIHQYEWLSKSREQLKQGGDAYFVKISNYYNENDSISNRFRNKASVDTIIQHRNNVPVRKFYIIRLKDYK